jgi:muconate cycloisomerase
MNIVEFEIITVEIPMRITVEHALARRNIARNVLVVARDKTGLTGWGESCPRPYVTGETVESVTDALAKDILPQLLNSQFTSFNQTIEKLEQILATIPKNRQAAFCACELATLDLAGKFFEVTAAKPLGTIRHPTVFYSGVIATENIAKAKKYAWLMKLAAVKNVKVKVTTSLDQNLAILKAVRSVLGERVRLRIDANGAFSADQAISQLNAMAPYNLAGIEQPVPADNIEDMKTITAANITPVVADESLCSLTDAKTLIKEHACNVFNIRISKCGGLINSYKIYQLAETAGILCQLGAQVGETGILSAAGRHLATRCPNLLWLEGSYGSILLKHDITKPNMTIRFAGKAAAINSPGLGVTPIIKRIEKYKTQRLVIS